MQGAKTLALLLGQRHVMVKFRTELLQHSRDRLHHGRLLLLLMRRAPRVLRPGVQSSRDVGHQAHASQPKPSDAPHGPPVGPSRPLRRQEGDADGERIDDRGN